jgi:ribosome biogenesis GTPase
MLASNIDVAFIVQACDYDFNMDRLERYLMMASEGRTEARIVLSKTDMVSSVELEQRLAQIAGADFSVPTFPLSNVSGVGLDDFRALLAPGKTYCLLGSSGVGKTTLINRLIGSNAFATKAVGETGEGMHTTTRRHLLVLEGGAMLIDTPGMRELGLIGSSEAVQDTFADLNELALSCRFSNCTHGREPGCAVLQAVASGTLSEKRYRNYLKLKEEANFMISVTSRSAGRTRNPGRSSRLPRRGMKE